MFKKYEYQKKWYSSNKERQVAYRKNKRQLNKIKAIKYLGNSCNICKVKYPICVYDFHHINPHIKEINISYMFTWKFEKIIPELDKCILLCSNCHRILHFGNRGSND